MVATEHDAGDRTPLVPFVPFRCPSCGRHKPRTGHVRGRVRYHQCQACGTRYRSLEMPAAAVREFAEQSQASASQIAAHVDHVAAVEPWTRRARHHQDMGMAG
jgi:predicted RNA-binding Zn-ribbon protein involved in translation (DUF1610 family)